MFIEYYLYYLYYTYLGYPFVIRLASFFACLFLLVILTNGVLFLNLRRKFYKKKRIREEAESDFGDQFKSIITSTVNFTNDDIRRRVKLNPQKLNKLKKTVFTDILIDISMNTKFINNHNYTLLVNFLQLSTFWEKKLKSGSTGVKMDALRKIKILQVDVTGSIIASITYHRNEYLRKHARSYYMSFSKNSPYKFLDEDFDYTINDWDKIVLHYVFNLNRYNNLPSFIKWAKKSHNVNFQCFMIDEIIFYDQTESCPSLQEMMKTDNIELQKECILALGSMNYIDADTVLINDYLLQPAVIQDTIIESVQKLNSDKVLPFLHLAYTKTQDAEEAILRLRAIYNYGEEGVSLFNELKSEDTESSLLFEHVSNPLIKY